ncbi:hypothetical protein KR009_003640 [Drosophila setifemur]|nr:hypothetical protein KR009_003640 [Drosophila setifemur]
MSTMKGGFSTLNRWFGRKKDKSGTGSSSMGKLSKSTTQLHHLSTDTDINEASQLEYNRITPVPAATSNAPFEQTFRITVLLPKDQLFVARLGARVPLSKLLSLVCDNKQLDADKYEFRSPVDASQVYSCESTIGAVGLSEIRLCHKSESYDNFNPDAMTMHKFHRTGAARDSLSSSSEFSSSRNSKITAKTPSPYSSSNSLNSMDSTGMNYTRTPVVVPPAKVLAPPPRKKRAAPRPPSQICIPEQSVPEMPAHPHPHPAEPAYAVIVKRPQMCMSTPNLSAQPELDCNGNSSKAREEDSPDGHYATLDLKPLAGGGGGSGPEPTPRKRLIQIKKKAAPAPPPEFMSGGDTISLASLPEVASPPPANAPQPAPRITTPLPLASAVSPSLVATPGPVTAAPAAPAASAAAPASPASPAALAPVHPPPPASPAPPVPSVQPASPASPAPSSPQVNGNVSKVLLNRTPTPEPRSLGSATEEDYNDAASKQADSGIGEPVPSPSASPEPEESKSQQESSSEDDEAIKVYNFKLCQTSKKAEPPLATSLAELAVLNAEEEEDEEEALVGQQVTTNGNAGTPNSASEQTSLSSWNYSGPISPPPDFSDQGQQAKSQRSVASSSPGSPLDEIVDELSAIINQQKLDTLIRKQPDPRLAEIEAAKPSRLTNFSIATAKTNTRISRADSFQAAGSELASPGAGGGAPLSLRSSSHVSLNKLEQQNGYPLGQRRSSSELSIGESPSLQSLEVIKTILNSRKNSLAESGGSASPPPLPSLEQPKISSSPLEQLTKEQSLVDGVARGGGSPVSPISTIKEQSPAKELPKIVALDSGEKKESPLPAPKKESPLPTPKKESPLPVQKKESPLPVPKKESPLPASKKASPLPVQKQLRSSYVTEQVTSTMAFQETKPVLKQSPEKALPEQTPPVVRTPPPTLQKPSPPAMKRAVPNQIQMEQVTPPTAVKESSPSSPASPLSPVALRAQNGGESQQKESASPESFESSPSSKPVPTTYRYSGPPSINFATWSERPKSQVAIKNEGDYIFGGAGKSQGVNKLTIEVASPILRMGISQRKEYHVPITVKPLRDGQVQVSQPEPQSQPEKPSSIPEEVKQMPVQTQTQIQVKQQVQIQSQSQSQVQVQSSTLPRPSKSNRFTLPAGNHIQVVTSSTTTSSSSHSNSNSLPRPVSSLERNRPVETPPTAAPFGQNTLRRTGFKERMLAQEQKEQEQARSTHKMVVSVNGHASPPVTPKSPPAVAKFAPAVAKSPPVTLKSPSAAVKSPPVTPTSPPATTKSPPATKAKPVTALRTSKYELKLEVTEPEVRVLPVLRPTSRPASAAVPPPPPPQMAMSLKPVKSQPGRSASSQSPMADPRSQLLDAIRNFKRDELNRS